MFTAVIYCMFTLTHKYFFFSFPVWNGGFLSIISTYISCYLNMQRTITLLNWQTKFILCLLNWFIRHNHNTFLDKKGHCFGLVKGVVYFSYFILTMLSGQSNTTVLSKWRLPNGMQGARKFFPKSRFYWFRQQALEDMLQSVFWKTASETYENGFGLINSKCESRAYFMILDK